MDHVMYNFGNINYKTKLEVKVSLMERENFELKGQLIDKMLAIKQLKTNSKSNPLPPDVSTATNPITTPAQTRDNINSNDDNISNSNNNNNNSINNNDCKNMNNGNNNNKNKNDSINNEKAVYNKKLQAQLQEIRKEKHTNFLDLKTYEEQAKFQKQPPEVFCKKRCP